MKISNLIILLLSSFTIAAQTYTAYESYGEMKTHLLDELDSDKTYIINYWATWCKPCVEELPLFEEITAQHIPNLEVILVSLDFPHQIDSKFKPFLIKRDLRSKVVLLLDGKYNQWIDKVDTSWSGAIPATLYLNQKGKYFHEGQYSTIEEILADIKKINTTHNTK